MNCAEIAVALQETLLHQRDPEWVREARRHGERCPSCARLLALQQVEERLAGLPAIEPSNALLEAVMNRIAEPEPLPVASLPAGDCCFGMFKYPTVFVGALILVFAFIVPAAGQSWQSNLWPSARLVRLIGMSTYLLQHPLWAAILAGFAALLILVGLVLPDPPMRKSI